MFTPFRVLRAVKFLFMAPFILALLFVVNVMAWHGHWWVQWAALGLGIAWVICLFRVLKAAILVGGLAALGTYLMGRKNSSL
jgi:hypothetical protein